MPPYFQALPIHCVIPDKESENEVHAQKFCWLYGWTRINSCKVPIKTSVIVLSLRLHSISIRLDYVKTG